LRPGGDCCGARARCPTAACGAAVEGCSKTAAAVVVAAAAFLFAAEAPVAAVGGVVVEADFVVVAAAAEYSPCRGWWLCVGRWWQTVTWRLRTSSSPSSAPLCSRRQSPAPWAVQLGCTTDTRNFATEIGLEKLCVSFSYLKAIEKLIL
jgi:hypothetical protein